MSNIDSYVRVSFRKGVLHSVSVLVALAQALPADAHGWDFRAFYVPKSIPMAVVDMNDDRTILGEWTSWSGKTHLFLRTRNGIQKFDIPNAVNYFGSERINASGVIAGFYRDNLNHDYGFVRSPAGQITTFQIGSLPQMLVSDLNDAGQIVGTYYDQYAGAHGFVRAPDGSYSSIDVPGASGTYAYAINNFGAVAGWFEKNSAGFGYIRSADGTFTTFQIAAAPFGPYPKAINAKNEVTGWYYDSSYGTHSFLRDAAGEIITIDLGNKTGTNAVDINDRGYVVGSFVDTTTGYCGGDNRTCYGFIRAASGRITVINPSYSNSGAAAINSHSDVAGTFDDCDQPACYSWSTDGFLMKHKK